MCSKVVFIIREVVLVQKYIQQGQIRERFGVSSLCLVGSHCSGNAASLFADFNVVGFE